MQKQDREHRALLRAAERERRVDLAKSLLLGQPKPYNWAKQNYNSGHDQALHKCAHAIREMGDEG